MPDYKSIEDFDKEWEEKLKETEETSANSEETEEIEETEEVEEVKEIEETEEITEEGIEEIVDPEPVDKKEYAFKEMRTKNQELQTRLSEKEETNSKYEDMAHSLGYANATEMLKTFEEQRIQKEAETKGIDPDIYKRMHEMEKELKDTKQQRASEVKQTKINKFVNTLDELTSKHGLSEAEKTEVINALENDGYTIDNLIAIKSPKKLLSGYMIDKITEKKVQSKIKNDKQEEFREEKHTGNSEVTEDDIAKMVAEDMKRYAKENGLHYPN